MYLKSLTLRGFKSFASATSLRLETGITCVVGPNGSGKSNIVDALCWVMGEQGAKSLRGGKMEDVVFAGTTSRAPLGRAEVTLTIDNSDGALPIEYAEVTISRLMFRSGQSEYAINGDRCRLLDVQELLSDSGLGREMHVIVGQGQLDTVLHAGPEARRALIEEAAGVLKHRRRKEKALRKLEAMQANLTRLVDLTAELSRRLKPLGRQAEVARRAAAIQADLRDSRLRLLADDYVTLAAKLEADEADEAAVLARRAALESSLAEARRREAELDAAAQQHAAVLARAQETWFGLSSLAERLRSAHGLARGAAPAPVRRAGSRSGRAGIRTSSNGRRPSFREEEESLQARLAVGRDRLSAAVAERSGAEAQLAAVERRIAEDARAAANRADRSRPAAGPGRCGQQPPGGDGGGDRAAERAPPRRPAPGPNAPSRSTARSRNWCRATTKAAPSWPPRTRRRRPRWPRLPAGSRSCGPPRARRPGTYAALRARADALQEAFRRGADASADLLATSGRFSGIIGPFAEALSVEEGAQTAIAAALGAVRQRGRGHRPERGHRHPDRAARIRRRHRRARDRRLPGSRPFPHRAARRAPAGAGLPPGARYALDLVRASDELRPAVTQLLSGVIVAASLEQAADLLRASPALRVVTRDGDLLGPHWATGGSAGQQSLLEVRAAADDAAAGSARGPGTVRAGRPAARGRRPGRGSRARRRWTRPGPGCARPTRPPPRSPAGSAGSRAPPGPRATRYGGWRRRSTPPAGPARRTWRGWPSSPAASPRPRRRRTPNGRRPEPGTARTPVTAPAQAPGGGQGNAGPAVHDGAQRRDGSPPRGPHRGRTAPGHRRAGRHADRGRGGRAAGP